MLLHKNFLGGIPTLFSPSEDKGQPHVMSHGRSKPHSASSHGTASSTATLLNDFVTSFTINTWGITLTLPDFPSAIGVHTVNRHV